MRGKDKKLYCDGCGKCITYGKGKRKSEFSVLRLEMHGRSAQVRSQLGKYFTGKREHTFDFCMECWLDSLFLRFS